MITADGKKLQIFSAFLLDDTLPKFESQGLDRDSIANIGYHIEGIAREGMHINTVNRNAREITSDMMLQASFTAHRGMSSNREVVYPRYRHKNKAIEAIGNMILNKINKVKDPKDIFSEIITNKSELENDAETYLELERLLDNAEKTNQLSYAQNIKSELQTYKNEQKLLELGYKNYVTEKQIVDVYKNSSRLMRLDWIQNFNRSIPKKIVDEIDQLNKEHIFDNYVILHYDPFRIGSSAKTITEKEHEKEKAKDPILFGVMVSTNKLYMIADWEDEYCDLTWDKLKEMTDTERIEYQKYQSNDGHKVELFKD